MLKSLIIVSLSCFGIFAFSQNGDYSKINVVSSASIFQDMAKEIGGDYIHSQCIVPIGGDPHIYEPKPSDVTLLKEADIILINGLTFEGWIYKIIENSGTNAKVVLITEGIQPIQSTTYHNASDPHAWMDATNGLVYASNIKKAIVDVLPEAADEIQKRYYKYISDLIDLDKYIVNRINEIPAEKRVLITSHDAFAYYGKRYGLQLNALKGISTEAETQTSDMVRIAEAIKQSGVPAIFIESTINPKVIQQIATDNGVKVGGELFADSIGDEDSDAPTYLTMLKHNTDVIVDALTDTQDRLTKIDSDNKKYNTYIYLTIGFIMIGGLAYVVINLNQ